MAWEAMKGIVAKGGPENALSMHLNFKKAFQDAVRQHQISQVDAERKHFNDMQTVRQTGANAALVAGIGQGSIDPNQARQQILSEDSSGQQGQPNQPVSPNATDVASSGGLQDSSIMPQSSTQPYQSPKLKEAIATKKSAQQDKLENQAMQRLSSVRGDSPMAKIEVQRDAAASAYNTLSAAEHEGRLPTQVEYYDLLGQLWKARAGAAPTEQVMKDLNIGTIEQKLNRAAQYFTGTPKNANTAQVIASLKKFVETTGNSLDIQHEGYFKTHDIKPKGLDQDIWDNLKTVHRGYSFKEATQKYKESLGQSPSGGGQQEDPLGLRN